MRWREIAVVAFAIALLDAALTFDNVWPTLGIAPALVLSVEIALLVLGIALAAERFGPPSRRVLSALAVVLVLLSLGRYAAETARALYGRPINLYYDAGHVPKVAAMLAEAAPLRVTLAAGLGALLGIALLYAMLRWALGRVAATVERRAPRRVLAAVAALVIAGYVGAQAGKAGEDWFATPVTATYAGQVSLLGKALKQTAPELPPAPPIESDLARLGGADVMVMFVESYGASTFDRPELAQALHPARAALAAAIAAGGQGVVSAFVAAPTFGGGSWLSHASLMSATEVRDGDAYNILMTQRRETLVQAFARRGYRTVALMPGLRTDWLESAFYRFDDIYGADRLAYHGPAFGWWRIPDQYALAKIHRAEVAVRPRAPLFVFFPTITSHAPFRPTPPYQPDWGRMLTDAPFDAGETDAAMAQRAEWSRLAPAYADSVGYALRCLAGYLGVHGGAEAVWVVLGDHQPAASITGAGASWEVPVHVIASRPAVLEALVASGFTPGLVPHRPALGRTDQLTPLLLRAFGGREASVDIARPRVVRHSVEPRAEPSGL